MSRRPRPVGARGAAASIRSRVQQALAARQRRGTGAGDTVAGNRVDRHRSGELAAHRRRPSATSSSARAAARRCTVGDVATVVDGGGEPTDYVMQHPRRGQAYPAVTLSIAKRKGTNAIDVTRAVEREGRDAARATLAAARRARDRSRATTARRRPRSRTSCSGTCCSPSLSVSALIWLVLGRRESVVVLIAIPVTLALTLFVFYLYGYTLNRITLFALIFSIGILVDDAIVVVENIVRHARMSRDGREPRRRSRSRAVDEVGNPTILATLAVIAAILPMAFVGGLMGPVHAADSGRRVGGDGLLAGRRVRRHAVGRRPAARSRPHAARRTSAEDRLTRALPPRDGAAHRDAPAARVGFLGAASRSCCCVGAVALVPLGLVTVKMLPFDNKSELQVIVRHARGHAARNDGRRRVGARRRVRCATAPVTSVQSYAGTAAPYNFNGLVRHYFLRRAPNLADLQVKLVPQGRAARAEPRHRRSGCATRLDPARRRVSARASRSSRCRPGPPVLQTLVAEVYGPDAARRLELARTVRAIFEHTPGRRRRRLVRRVAAAEAARSRSTARRPRPPGLSAADDRGGRPAWPASGDAGGPAARSARARGRADRPAAAARSSRVARRGAQRFASAGAMPVAVGELTRAVASDEEQSVYHKNLQPVTYVTGDVAGQIESPVYAILQMNRAARRRSACRRATASRSSTRASRSTRSKYAMKWDGEWHITIRGLPRSRHRVRRRARPDLHPRRRLVPVVRDAADDHARDSVLARRHPAGARAARRVLHGHVDDRLHRRRRHRRPQLDHPGGLHRAARAGRDVASRTRWSTPAPCASGRWR